MAHWAYIAAIGKEYMRKILSYCIYCSFMLCSCKSIRGLSASDKSAANRPVAKKNNSNSPVFIEQISVTPGTTAASKNYSSSSKNNLPAPSYSNYSPGSFNVENASLLQLKYAIITNMNVEQLTNAALLDNIEKWWGTRYCMGGTTDRCIDCSAFTQSMMQSVYNISLPRTARDQYDATQRISYTELKQGDLVFFHTTGRVVSHVGLYLGNNKFVHASSSNGVTISDLTESYWSARYIGAGRVTN